VQKKTLKTYGTGDFIHSASSRITNTWSEFSYGVV